jgi:pyruvate/oxaloacetate carboxyltransferase
MKNAEGDEPMSLVIISVNDGGIILTPEAIEEVIKALRKIFKVETMS